MPRHRFGPRPDQLTSRFSRDLIAARAVAGLTQREVARRAGVSQAFVSQAERGLALPSLPVMHRLASATGHDLAVRFYPADGVRLRDSGQLRVAEQIRRAAHPNRRVRLEVPVATAPDRRAADMVLDSSGELVAVEVERALLDLQAQLRSAQLKRVALAETMGRPVRLLIAVPDTRRNRAVVEEHRSLIESALPMPSRQLWSCLRAGVPIAGDGLLWVRSRSPSGR